MPVTKTPAAADANFEAFVGQAFDDDVEFAVAKNKRVDAKFFLKPIQDMVLVIRDIMLASNQVLQVRNNNAFILERGDLHFVSGYDSTNDRHELTRAIATAAGTLAGYVLEKDLAVNANGLAFAYRIITGTVAEPVDTLGQSEGDAVFLSAGTAGEFVFTAPTAPNLNQQIGIVLIVSATVGSILYFPGGLNSATKVKAEQDAAAAFNYSPLEALALS